MGGLCVLLCLLAGTAITSASHFRGMSISSKPVSGPGVPNNTVTITFRISWRRSHSSGYFCDQNTIDTQKLIGDSAYINCAGGCSGRAVRTSFFCTDFSLSEDWTTGERSADYTFPGNATYQLNFAGQAWINLVSGGGWWDVRHTVNMTRRPDIGRLNTSPIVAITPIVRLQHGCNSTITIPVDDVDGDDIRCRWAEASKSECAGVCNAFPNSQLVSGECQIQYSAIYNTGWYAVAVMVEDFATETATLALSSVPVQFLVYVFSSSEPCTSKPEFVGRTRADKSCVGVPFSSTLSEQVVVASETVMVTDITTTSPVGLTKSAVNQVSEGVNQWYINYTWTPTTAQLGPNIFCFQGKDSAGLSTAQRCITLLGGVEAPAYVPNTQAPATGAEIFPNHTKWAIRVDKEFDRPPRSTHIILTDLTSGNVVRRIDASTSPLLTYPGVGSVDRTLHFEIDFPFREKTSYALTFEPGVVVGTTYCGAEADGMHNYNFWNFTILDVTPPVVTFPGVVDRSNGNVTVIIDLDEPGTTTCTLQSPVATNIVDCSDKSFNAYELAVEGYYTLHVTATDTAGNIAPAARTTWFVDLTAPTTTLQQVPGATSNQSSPSISYSCSERRQSHCSFRCSLVEQGEQESYEDCSRSYTPNLENGKSYTFKVYAVDSVGNVGQPVDHSWLVDLIPPTLTDVSALTVDCGVSVSPDDIGEPTAEDNYDLNPRLTYRDVLQPQCRIGRVWTARDSAGNEHTETQVITLANPKPPTVQYEPTLILACTEFAEGEEEDRYFRAISVSHPCGRDTELTYTDSVPNVECGNTFTRSWKVTDDCGEEFTFSQTVKILELVDPDYPFNGQVNVPLSPTLRWPAYPGAALYNIYVWPYGTPQPTEPTLAQTPIRSFTVREAFKPTRRILWEIEYYVDGVLYPSPVWGFTTRSYTNLAVTEILVPDTAFSGQSFNIQWTVENKGDQGTVSRSWSDIVYYGKSLDWKQAKRVSSVWQQRYLDPNDGYTATATINLAQDEVGSYFVFLQTDYYFSVDDYDRSDNVLRSDSPVQVSLTPPPNLHVTAIQTSATTFSGQDIFVTWTVTNTGVGPTLGSSWSDAVFLFKADADTTADAPPPVRLGTFTHTGALSPSTSYTSTQSVLVPNAIFGNYTVSVHTDVSKAIYEHGFDNDNVKESENPVLVTLAPPPDLVVSEFSVDPLEIQNGQSFSVSYEVMNDGFGAPFETSSWTDILVFKGDKGDVELSRVNVYEPLEPTASYRRQVTGTIPADTRSGRYSLALYTDATDKIFEHTSEENNHREVIVDVVNLPPDLKPIELVPRVLQNSKEAKVGARYSVQNMGEGSTSGLVWYDALYLSTTPSLNLQQQPLLLKRSKRDIRIAPGKSQEFTVDNVPVPRSLVGRRYIIVRVNSADELAESDTGNNVLVSQQVEIPNVNPELVPMDVFVSPERISAGNNITVSWKLMNRGLGTLFARSSMIVNIFVSTKAELDFSSLIIAQQVIMKDLDILASQNMSVKALIPEELAGDYFLLVKVPEETNPLETNPSNLVATVPITIHAASSPDFVPMINEVSHADSTELVYVTWSVVNQGNSMVPTAGRRWCDRVVLSSTAGVISGTGAYSLGEECFDVRLQHRQSYTASQPFLVTQIPPGRYIIHVVADATKSVAERNGEDNNVAYSSNVVQISKAREASLRISDVDFQAPDEVLAGDDIVVAYTVSNAGEYTTRSQSWIDAVYVYPEKLNSISEILQRGFFIKQLLHSGALSKGDSYSGAISFPFPYGFQSSVHWHLVIDINSRLGTEVFDVSASSTEVLVDALPDLRFKVTEEDEPGTTHSTPSGQPYDVTFRIENVGTAPVRAVATSTWYLGVYLSTDALVDPFDVKLSTTPVTGTIAVNATLDLPLSLFIPFDLPTLTYYLIAVLDRRNDIYELDEDNNILTTLLDVQETSSTDVTVQDVQFSKTQVAFAEDFDMLWKVTNLGVLDVKGYKCDSLYLSEDAVWDIKDIEVVAPQCTMADLKALSPVAYRTNNIPAPLVLDAELYGLVRSRSNIRDFHLENNIGVSSNTLHVSYPELTLDVPLSHQVADASGFIVRNVPFGETLIITAESQSGLHDIYVRHQRPATAYQYDATSTYPSGANQQSIVPFSKAGDYYILVENTDIQPSNSVILVKIAKFEILSVSPPTISTQKSSTVHVRGTLFGEVCEVYLVNDKVEVLSGKVYRMSSTDLHATFHGPLTEGEYKVKLVDVFSRETTTSLEVISVKVSAPGKFSSAMMLQRSMRRNQIGAGRVVLQNAGNTDVGGLFLELTSYGVGNLQLIHGGQAITPFRESHMFIPFVSSGPTGILHPKSSTTLDFFMGPKVNNPVGTILVRLSYSPLKANEPNPFLDKKDEYRDRAWTSHQFDPLWRNFVSALGDTAASTAIQLSQLSSTLSLVRQNVFLVNDLVNYQLGLSNGAQTGSRFFETVDVDVTQSKLRHLLSVSRYYFPHITKRRALGFFGFGWSGPIWQIMALQLDEEHVVVYWDMEEIYFQKDASDIFRSKRSPMYITVCDDDLLVHAPEHENVELVISRGTRRVARMRTAGASEDDWVTIQYDADITRPLSLSHHWMTLDLEYSGNQLITAAILSDSSGAVLQRSDYQYSDLLLTGVVTTRGGPWTYTYNSNNDLVAVQREGVDTAATTVECVYNNNDLLSALKEETGAMKREIRWDYQVDGRTVVTYQPGERRIELVHDVNFKVASALDLSDGSRGQIKVMESMWTDELVIMQADQVRYEERYNEVMHQRTVTDSDGADTHYKLGPNGEVLEILDRMNTMYRLSYNPSGRLSSVEYPNYDDTTSSTSSTTQNFTYDDHGRVASYTARNDLTIDYEYAAEDSVVTVNRPGGKFTYLSFDNVGRVTSASTPHLTQLSYNGHGLPERFSNGKLGSTLIYSYTDSGKLSGIQIDDDFSTAYAYNNEYGKLASVTINYNGESKRVLEVTYDDQGRVKRREYTSSFMDYEYHPSTGYLLSLRNRFPNGTIISDYQLSYDRTGRVVTVNSSSEIDNNNDNNWEFGYDINGQLSTWKLSSGPDAPNSNEITYDSRGRRVSVAESAADGTQSSSSCITNQLSQYTSCKDDRYEWDANGNLMFVRRGGVKVDSNTYDELNKLTAIKEDGCMFSYDGFGNLEKTSCYSMNTVDVVDPFSPSGPVPVKRSQLGNTTYYIDVPGHGILGQYDAQTESYQQYIFDPFGSVMSVMSEAGDVLNQYAYDPFGNILSAEESTPPCAFKYHGQRGMIHMEEEMSVTAYRHGQRIYSPVVAQFINGPPVWIPDDYSSHELPDIYLSNNPARPLIVDDVRSFLPSVESFTYRAKLQTTPISVTLTSEMADPTDRLLHGSGIVVRPYQPFSTSCSMRESRRKRRHTGLHGTSRSKRNLLEFGLLIMLQTGRGFWNYIGYGCWCGKGGGGPTLDGIDQCCEIHDRCYNSVNSSNVCPWYLGPKSVSYLPTHKLGLLNLRFHTECAIHTYLCDTTAARCFARYPYNDAYYNTDDPRCQETTTPMSTPPSSTTPSSTTPTTTPPTTTPLPPPLCDGPPPAGSSSEDCSEWPRSRDPNDMLGPAGYGDARFIPSSTTLQYTIRFENHENASAPAQRVYVVHTLDDDLDIRTFKVGSFGFGTFNRTIENGRTYLQENLDFIDSEGYVVRVQAGINIDNRQASWELLTLDPATGQAPSDALVGFLPPNNGSSGQGFIQFSIRPRRDVQSLAVINAEASIYFDENDPIDTPPIFNTIDADIPSCTISVMDDLLTSGSLALKLQAQDGGAGVRSLAIYQKTAEEVLLVNSVSGEEELALLDVPSGYTYKLFTLAEDHVGHEQEVETANVVEVFVPHRQVSCAAMNNCSDHGMCSSLGVCQCDDGYYGDDCSLDSAPLEPPVIEASAAVGEEDVPVQLYLSAYSSSTSSTDPSTLYLDIIDLPPGASLNKGSEISAGTITVSQEDFGDGFELTMPTDLSGTFEVSLLAREVQGSQSSERAGVLKIEIQGRADEPKLNVDEACFVPSAAVQLVSVSVLEAKSTDADSSEMLKLVLDDLPFGVSVIGTAGNEILQRAELEYWSDLKLRVLPEIQEPFQVSISLVADDDGDTAESTMSLDVVLCKTTTVETSTKDGDGGKKSRASYSEINILSVIMILGFAVLPILIV